MGNSSSVPERIYKAARANDVNELQVWLAGVAAAGPSAVAAWE
jgi:adenylylsulfate kinase-like enzyme